MPEPFNIFGVDLAGKIGRAFSSKVFDITLTKVEPGTRGGNLTGGTSPTEVEYTVKGFEDSYKESQIDGTLVQKGDRKFSIFGSSLPSGVVPEPNDTLTLAGNEWTIVEGGVKSDPARAVYECQCR